jgi:hypothetical protein
MLGRAQIRCPIKVSEPENRKTNRTLPAAAEPYKFKPGVSGNPGGRPKKTPLTDLFSEMLDQPETIEMVRKSVVEMIKSGRMVSQLMLKEMAERVEGKVSQTLELNGDLTLTISERMKKAEERIGKPATD